MAQVISEFGTIVGSPNSDIQVGTMPTYTDVPLGTIVQFIGTTDTNYTNGYFYKRGASGWEQANVQPAADISGKADKVTGATNGNLASLDGNGNLTDAGVALNISTPADKDLLQYDSANSKWVNNGDIPNSIEAIVNVYGSKNLNSYPYDETTKVYNGITYTDNGDGTFTAVGTASTGASSFVCHDKSLKTLFLKNGTYKVTGCPSGGNYQNGYSLIFEYKKSNGGNVTLYDEGNGVTIDINGGYERSDGAYISLYVVIRQNTVISTPIIFKPMLRDARITDDTYVPYAMTNRELTENVSFKELYNQSTSLAANTLTDIVEFTVDHPIVLSAWFATTASTDVLDILVYAKNNGTYTNVSGVTNAGAITLACVLSAGTYKVTLRCNTAQTSRPCRVNYK